MMVYHAIQTLIAKVVRGCYFCMCNHQYWVGVSFQKRYSHGRSGRSVSYGPDLCHILPYFVVFLVFCPSNSQRKYRERAPMRQIQWHKSEPRAFRVIIIGKQI